MSAEISQEARTASAFALRSSEQVEHSMASLQPLRKAGSKAKLEQARVSMRGMNYYMSKIQSGNATESDLRGYHEACALAHKGIAKTLQDAGFPDMFRPNWDAAQAHDKVAQILLRGIAGATGHNRDRTVAP